MAVAFPSRSELERVLRRDQDTRRRVTALVVALAVVVAVLFPILLTRISPKRAGAVQWIAVMSTLFAAAIHFGRKAEGAIAAASARCPACTGVIGGSWTDTVLDRGLCPHCHRALF